MPESRSQQRKLRPYAAWHPLWVPTRRNKLSDWTPVPTFTELVEWIEGQQHATLMFNASNPDKIELLMTIAESFKFHHRDKGFRECAALALESHDDGVRLRLELRGENGLAAARHYLNLIKTGMLPGEALVEVRREFDAPNGIKEDILQHYFAGVHPTEHNVRTFMQKACELKENNPGLPIPHLARLVCLSMAKARWTAQTGFDEEQFDQGMGTPYPPSN